jgi:glycosyltransferase involved in cell wall biosynthesis
MPLKICFIVGEEKTNYCGVKDYTYCLASALGRNGITATVSAPPNWGTKAFFSFCRHLRELNYDIIHIQYPSIGFRWSLWPHFAGCLTSYGRSAVTLHEYSKSPAVQRFSTHLFRWTTDEVIFTTEIEAANFRATLGKSGPVQRIIPIGSNVPTHPADLARDLNVIYFGEVRPGKGIEEFINLARLSFRLSRPFSFLVVAGVPPRRAEYYRTIREQTPSSVQWLINLPLDDVAEVLARSYAAYLPFPDGASYRRGSMLAAMANGLPIITRAGPGTVPELRDVLMLATGPDEALAHLDAMYDGRECAQAKTAQARSLVQRFSWEEIALRHAEIYAAMLSGRPRKGDNQLDWPQSGGRRSVSLFHTEAPPESLDQDRST